MAGLECMNTGSAAKSLTISRHTGKHGLLVHELFEAWQVTVVHVILIILNLDRGIYQTFSL